MAGNSDSRRFTKVRLLTTPEHATRRLDHVLAEWLPQVLGRAVSKAKGRKLILVGAVYLNGRPERTPSKALVAGSTIEARIDLEKLFEDATSKDRKFELTPDRVLFEDEDLIVIDKPPGLPSQPTLDQGRDNLFAAVTRFLSKREGVIEPYVGVHQRLDRDTSGVVLFTKSGRVNAAVGEIFSNRRGRKIYQALTSRPKSGPRRKLEKEWTIKNRLGEISTKSKRAQYGSVNAGGAFAETLFRVLAEYSRGIRIEAIPRTGRTHQIRVHLSEYGLPILGDDLYGGDTGIAPRLMLHASQLIFPHPITKREICVESTLPTDFENCLSRIAAD